MIIPRKLHENSDNLTAEDQPYLYWLVGLTGLIRRLVGDPVIHPGVPGVEVELLVVQPGAVGEAHLQGGDPDYPVRRGSQHAHHGDQVVPGQDHLGQESGPCHRSNLPGVCPEYGECLPVDVRVPESPRLDDRPDVTTLGLQFGLQNSRRAPLGHLRQSLAGHASGLPHSRKFSGESVGVSRIRCIVMETWISDTVIHHSLETGDLPVVKVVRSSNDI